MSPNTTPSAAIVSGNRIEVRSAGPGSTVVSATIVYSLEFPMPNILDVLHERGFVQQVSEEDDLRTRAEQPITLYCGYDPTNTSLTVGNLATVMMLAWFQRCGHRPIVLMGGGTAMIGDPSGKTVSRPILSEEEIERNLQAQKVQ